MRSALGGVAARAVGLSIGLAIGLSVGGSTAWGQLVLTVDERAVLVEAAGSNQAAFPASAFALFDRDITLSGPTGGGTGHARAAQNSSVSATALSAMGMSLAESQAGPSGCVLSQATSDFRVSFHVTTPVQYSLSGAVDGAQFRLAESVSGTVHLVIAPAGTPTPFAFGAVLKPGRQYLLLAQSSQLVSACDGGQLFGTGTYELTGSFESLAPCPGDLNFDRVVDDVDFQIFLVAYNTLLCPEAPLPCDADLNADGFVNDEDFQIFLVGYNALLCP